MAASEDETDHLGPLGSGGNRSGGVRAASTLDDPSPAQPVLAIAASEEHPGSKRLINTFENSARLGSFLDSLSDYVFVKDTENRIVRVNRAVANAMNTTPDAMAGCPSEEWHPRHAAQYHDDDREVIRRGRPILGIIEPHFAAGEGDPRLTSTDKYPLVDRSGKIFGILVIAREVSHPASDSRAANSGMDLEPMFDFADHMARELERAVTAIVGYADLVALEAVRDGDPSDMVDSLDGAGDQAAELVNRLRTFASSRDANLAEMDLNEVLIDSYPEVRAGLSDEVELEWRTADRPLPILGDSDQLQRVLKELVMNAGEAIVGAGRVTVRTEFVENAEDEADLVVLSVRDSGVGIPVSIQGRLFAGICTTKSAGESRGLSLCAASRIVGQHGGEIDFDSSPTDGTTFRVRLPIR